MSSSGDKSRSPVVANKRSNVRFVQSRLNFTRSCVSKVKRLVCGTSEPYLTELTAIRAGGFPFRGELDNLRGAIGIVFCEERAVRLIGWHEFLKFGDNPFRV